MKIALFPNIVKYVKDRTNMSDLRNINPDHFDLQGFGDVNFHSEEISNGQDTITMDNWDQFSNIQATHIDNQNDVQMPYDYRSAYDPFMENISTNDNNNGFSEVSLLPTCLSTTTTTIATMNYQLSCSLPISHNSFEEAYNPFTVSVTEQQQQTSHMIGELIPNNFNLYQHETNRKVPRYNFKQFNIWRPNTPFSSCRAYRRYACEEYPMKNMMDSFHYSSSGREARNRAEKNRRDRLNGSIQELSTLVPHVAESPRRVDKIAVLRFATHGLRLKHVFGKSFKNHNPHAANALMKLLDSFFITLTCNGQIVLISPSVEKHLGHCQTDLYGQNILNFTHPDDQNLLKQKLLPKNINSLWETHNERENDLFSSYTEAEEDRIDQKLREEKRNFTVRLARAGPKSEPTIYELVQISGNFRRSDMAPRGHKMNAFRSNLQLPRRSRHRDEILPLHKINGNDIELIAIARIVRPPTLSLFIDPNRLEYKTRHLIDGQIVDCDQRISIVAGYMKDEVRNLSPFTFIHQDDVRWVIVALRQMYDCNYSYGESTYRLFTRNGQIIYLHTKGYLEIDKSTNRVHSFICINTLLSEDEGKRRIMDMKTKFSIIINTKIPPASIDVPAAEDPQQLEKAVLCLIHDLKKNYSNEENSVPNRQQIKCSPCSSTFATTPSSQLMNSCPSSSNLAIISPATDSVKTSIERSVDVVNVTAAKHLKFGDISQNNKNINSFDTKLIKSNSFNEIPSNLHYISDITSSDYSIEKHEADLTNALSNSLCQLDYNLDQQLNSAEYIRDQGQKFHMPNTEERLTDILDEHKKQRQLYFNITTQLKGQHLSTPIQTRLESNPSTKHGNQLYNDTFLPQ